MISLRQSLFWMGLVLLTGSRPAWADSDFVVQGETVLTLRTGSTESRLADLEQRFATILTNAQSLKVTTQGSDDQARILLNDQLLLEVTREDAQANASNKASGLAQIWANRLQKILASEAVQRKLFGSVGLPPQVQVGGRYYTQQPDPVVDGGRFLTDGTRFQGLVIFWEGKPGQTKLPDPLPATLYLLNKNREFVPYRS